MPTENDNLQTVKDVKSAGGWMLAMGILSIIAGVLAIAMPLASSLSVAWIIGTVLAVVGVFTLIGTFQAGTYEGRGADILAGVLYLLGGILCFVLPQAALLTLTMLVTIFLCVRGVFQIWASLQVKPEKGWGWILFAGILSLVLGILLFSKLPGTALWLPGLFLGIELIFSGWTRIFLGSGLRQAASDA